MIYGENICMYTYMKTKQCVRSIKAAMNMKNQIKRYH
jgi:hypothetical protein